jgi:hypothetical protein
VTGLDSHPNPQVATDPQRRTFQTYPEQLLSVNVDFFGNPGRIFFVTSFVAQGTLACVPIQRRSLTRGPQPPSAAHSLHSRILVSPALFAVKTHAQARAIIQLVKELF